MSTHHELHCDACRSISPGFRSSIRGDGMEAGRTVQDLFSWLFLHAHCGGGGAVKIVTEHDEHFQRADYEGADEDE